MHENAIANPSITSTSLSKCSNTNIISYLNIEKCDRKYHKSPFDLWISSSFCCTHRAIIVVRGYLYKLMPVVVISRLHDFFVFVKDLDFISSCLIHLAGAEVAKIKSILTSSNGSTWLM